MLAELPLDKGSGETLPLFVHASSRMKPVIYAMGLTISRLKTVSRYQGNCFEDEALTPATLRSSCS
jgi:hypothetical protein